MLAVKTKIPTVPMTGRNFLPSGPMVSVTRPSNSPIEHLEEALSLRGDEAELPRHEPEDEREEDDHEEAHDDVVGHEMGRVGGLDPEEPQQGGQGLPEGPVEELDEGETVL